MLPPSTFFIVCCVACFSGDASAIHAASVVYDSGKGFVHITRVDWQACQVSWVALSIEGVSKWWVLQAAQANLSVRHLLLWQQKTWWEVPAWFQAMHGCLTN